ncbi:MAG: hypothetical protein FJ249_08490 [Nitrospira sp.]|nr:hypothetical protein [Nitrospira sp.]
MKRNGVVWVALLACLVFAACVPLPPVPANPSNPIRTVAVLPFVNNTNDVEAPAYVREQFLKELGRHQYVVKPAAEVDQVLKDQLGITLGAQLDLTDPKQLGETLGVDGVFYGSLDEFNHKITGIYNVKRVRLRTKLVNCKTGKTVWKNGIGVKTVLSTTTAGAAASVASTVQDDKETGEELKPLFGDTILAPWYELPKQQLPQGESAGQDVGVAFAAALGEKLITTALKVPLAVETNAAVNILLNGTYQADYLTPAVRVGAGAVPAGPGGAAPQR